MPSDHPHREHAPSSVAVAILSVSTSRNLEQDKSGDLIRDLLEDRGHRVTGREMVKDDVTLIRNAFGRLLGTAARAIVVTGGTGITPTDVTVEALHPLLDKELTAFGSLFTQLSYEEIGPAAILSRATAGVTNNKAVFCIPGSSKACRLAMEKIILPELTHLIAHLE
ncbi:MAG: molybdenum cofactor biosynthesis protein MoaB [Deltaproteobacteria bacterium]|nr:molybdenum cofactor biosynthesis protein MoaB [Deltaproteobacteria bacterium]